MSDVRRGTVVLIQRGDPAITGALARGLLAGKAEAADNRAEQVEIVTTEIDRQRQVAALVKVEVGNHKTTEDYLQLIIKANGDYATAPRSGPMEAVRGRLLLIWALFCEGVRYAFDAQRHVLGDRR